MSVLLRSLVGKNIQYFTLLRKINLILGVTLSYLAAQFLPVVLDVSLLVTDIITHVSVGLGQTVCLLAKGSDLLLQGSEVALHTVMFSLQGLHAGQVPSIVICREDGILLRDPGDGLVSITVEVLYLVSPEELLLATQGQVLQPLPGFIQLLKTRE